MDAPKHNTPRLLINYDLVGSFGARPNDSALLGDIVQNIQQLAKVLDWSANGGLRISNFQTIYEDENVFCAKHSVTQQNTGPSNVMVFAKHEYGKVTFWKVHRAFEL